MQSVAIKAEFTAIKDGCEPFTISIERIPEANPGYGDGSSHRVLVDGSEHGYYDTRYDWIPTEPARWCDWWVAWAEREFKAGQVLRTYLLWEAKEMRGDGK